MLSVLDELKKVNVAGVEPTSQVTGLENVIREDANDVTRIFTQDQALGTLHEHITDFLLWIRCWNNENYNTLTLTETINKLKAKEISHAELYRDIHESITEQNGKLNVYLTLDNEAVKKAEKLLDSPLAGAPIAVKDNYCTDGLRTTASSNVLKNFIPSFDATVISKLRSYWGSCPWKNEHGCMGTWQ